jgi:DNA-binding HxlR family transcriptional regulator
MRPGPSGQPQPAREPAVIDFADARTAVQLVASKWALPVLAALSTGPRRHGDLLRTIGSGLVEKVLTQTLRRMEDDGLVTRVLLDGEAIGYALTPLGQSMFMPLAGMSWWTQVHRDELPPHRNGRRDPAQQPPSR